MKCTYTKEKMKKKTKAIRSKLWFIYPGNKLPYRTCKNQQNADFYCNDLDQLKK